ncbi:5-formyltetrahydrofolate cyclo-ligase [Komagataeibacter nataicola]|uniref:5-formyltetrahydrofolate cyclo-ligase n=1 Tax=Komagataeibacter nataicola TaxID=265960 RepID=A0A9N7CGJ3_9PROT|nr:5-formyltetrahydrofolate cyclo-ligase [Komagataeibacter nataicola]AQU88959.1 5-formyltetrahydrofolate cyclo-ligase [Komagataeibacter nataicola]PYD65376.1 5-formyltetrahydrofolate cyclo-ligase [Komagataeibacter nataicola]WEQ55167.1 5-formyltetrahydrofolate cyclo-ligase [Komagataeibacter nataicola]WNM09942.1 5-formyltetrahydrofolate cyclo-ligase [Komagataeibacter nataicola]GBR24830.1 5-formyltetrahydrofolate cyclo-ligase [Komagataeibacter nataicola NRIC 0616]
MTSIANESWSTAHAKQALRGVMASRRAAFATAPGREMAEKSLQHRMVRALRAMAGAGEAIALVWPLPGESELQPVMHALHADGLCIALPETTPKGHKLAFRLWQPGCAMQAGRYGTSHPEGPIVQPDVVCVPLLAFDRRGMRLGYGGGYYDRTLASLPAARAVGFGFSFQEVACIPTGRYDVALPAIVTEREWIRCRGDGRTR